MQNYVKNIYFATKTGQVMAAWKQAKAMWTSTNRSYAVLKAVLIVTCA